MILNDVPDAAAVEAVDLHHGRQAIEIVLVGNDPPGVQEALGLELATMRPPGVPFPS